MKRSREEVEKACCGALEGLASSLLQMFVLWGPGAWLSWGICMGNSPTNCKHLLEPFPWRGPYFAPLFYSRPQIFMKRWVDVSLNKLASRFKTTRK